MSNPDLVTYIQEQTQQGVSAQTLREALMESGWQEMHIENAFHDVAAGLHPATPGASIHEDLAQVRGMVAHLASRVGHIEALLPSTFIGPDHELTHTESHAVFWRATSTIVLIGLSVWLGVYTTELISRAALAPLDQIIIAAALGLVLMCSAVASILWRAAWVASVLTAAAIALWAADIFIAWHVYHFTGWVVAVGLGVLLIAGIFAMGRWIDRFKSA